ncbi:hypothetical protein C2S51_022476 [Perilla frutescens var. frutescens]|nr:hypothetical protein C2S51_022476 [Perilla frutescens var. frutescens]
MGQRGGMAIIVLSVLMLTAVEGAGDLHVQAAEEKEVEDYTILNPAPYVGGAGYGAPIPHAKEACSCPRLPCSYNFNSN